MDLRTSGLLPDPSTDFLSGGGEMGRRIREYNWSNTPLGPVELWPQSLRTCIRIMLTSRQPIWIGWGRDLIKFYNDPYIAIVRGKHPWALGKPASVVWSDIWKDIEAMLQQVMVKDQGTYVESQLLIMERNGYPEETYYTFSYTPIPGDDGRTAGMFCANTDDTDKIISERQLKTLTQLGKRLTDCHTTEEIIERTMDTLQANPQDFPFALFRTIENEKAILAGSTPMGHSSGIIQKVIDLKSPEPIAQCINAALQNRRPEIFTGIRKKIGDMPTGAWELPPDKAIVLPITQTGVKDRNGIIVVGVNPYRLLDESYLGFFSLVADQVSTSFTDVHVLEEERKRSESLAELDRAKTIFFSNISHEFRTPLTLLLGPVEEILNDPQARRETKLRADVALRNAMRMQRLVNTLLDFSRIEAGRLEGQFSRVDISPYTKELAGTFESAIEKSGMTLHFEFQELKDDVYVDISMWEKIVINLISNAFKYSKQGSITVRIEQIGSQVLFSVKDTGIGIPADQLEKIFDRFHRIESVSGRSQEGTGIGLAMVRELVKIHVGNITVQSELGKGSTFTVALPVGKDHLPADKLAEVPRIRPFDYAHSFVQDAMRWLPSDERPGAQRDDNYKPAKRSADERKYVVLLADDNADMRDYIKRLLTPEFEVIAVSDGEAAYQAAIDENPDLILSDIMMPKLDGFALLTKIRSRPDRKLIPVIFLSARAGEDAKVEGLEAGADDYLVKPFSARELLARVETNIKISKARIAAENNLRSVIMQAPVGMTMLRGKNHVIEIANQRAIEQWGKEYDEVINKPVLDAFPELMEQGFYEIFENVFNTGEAYVANEMPVTLVRHGVPETIMVNFIFEPLRGDRNEIQGIVAVGVDVTAQVTARHKIEQSQRELVEMANSVPQLVWVANADGNVTYYNDRVKEFSGAFQKQDGTWQWESLVHPDDAHTTNEAWSKAIREGAAYQVEHRIRMKDGNYRWYLSRGFPLKDEKANVVKWFGSATDIHSAKEQSEWLEEEVKRRTMELNALNKDLLQSNNELQQFAHVASHDLKEPLRKIKIFTGRLASDEQNELSDKSRSFINKINSATDRMFTMIEGVLNYSVLNATVQKIGPVDLNGVLEDIRSDLELLIAEKHATITHNELPVIYGSPVLLYQLFYNLVYNSLKFSRVDVAVAIEVNATVSDDEATIQVRDNGIGFQPQFAEQIFESFARLNAKDRFEGTGLGLALCRRIVTRHGGSIRATGEPGVGAIFDIKLPVKINKDKI